MPDYKRDAELAKEAQERLSGGAELKHKPLVLTVQPEKFTQVPHDARDFWKEYFFAGLNLKFDPSRFEGNGTVSWCSEDVGPGQRLWPCDCDAG